jgi:hypothetical protein
MDDNDMVFKQNVERNFDVAVFDNGNKPTKMETQYGEIDDDVHLLIMQEQGPL